MTTTISRRNFVASSITAIGTVLTGIGGSAQGARPSPAPGPKPPPGPPPSHPNSATYYVSSAGSDQNAGTSPSAPWATIAKVNAHSFVAGDVVLFNGGDTFTGEVYLQAGQVGTPTAPVTFGSYGNGQATVLSSSSGLFFYNTGGIVLQDLTISGSAALGSGGAGIFFYADAGTTYNYIRLDDCTVTGFADGILFGSGKASSGFSNVTIEGCATYGNRDAGIESYGPSFTPSKPSYVHSNFTVTNCRSYDNLGNKANTASNTGNGIVLGGVTTGLITLSTAYGNGISNACAGGGPVGIWCYNSNAVTISSCVSYDNRSGTATDGDGIDLDINSTNCVVEYCLAYGNYGAGILAYGTNTYWAVNTVRYNLCWGNGQNPGTVANYYGDITVAGTTSYLACYNNTCVSRDQAFAVSPLVISGSPAADSFRNNILLAQSGPSAYATTAWTPAQAVMQGNDYCRRAGTSITWGSTTYTTLTAWQTAASQERNGSTLTGLTVDPRLVAPTSTPTVTDPTELDGAGGLMLAPGSPMRGAGLDLNHLFGTKVGSRDYFGDTLVSPYSIGADV